MTAVVTLITAVTLSYRSNSFLCCYACDKLVERCHGDDPVRL